MYWEEIINLYNTQSRKKELFKPIVPGKVWLYSCGPTVYSTQHVGNLRAAFVVDLLKRVLRDLWGYEVKHIMNITDVGHLTGDNEGDASQWEDRMEKWARKLWLTAWEVAEKYTAIYMKDLEILWIEASTDMNADHNKYILLPRATDHIQEQIDMVASMEKNWHTYVIEWDGVYMDTSTMKDFWVLLSEKHLEGIQEWVRVETYGRRNPTDFALRKFNVTGEKRAMEWESPWGIWFPGWHIECSAMATKYLGGHFDIHTGGMEHIPVHHTNEIAQAECSFCEKPRVNYRIHYQWLMMNGEKIAKSTGNVAYISELEERWYSGAEMRYFYCTGHYRSFHDFTWEWVENARKARNKIIGKLSMVLDNSTLDETYVTGELFSLLSKKLCDDLDTVWVLSSIHSSLKGDLVSKETALDILKIDEILWFQLLDGIIKISEQHSEKAPQKVQQRAQERREAKQNKDYEKADLLRDQIVAEGWTIKENKESWELLKNA